MQRKRSFEDLQSMVPNESQSVVSTTMDSSSSRNSEPTRASISSSSDSHINNTKVKLPYSPIQDKHLTKRAREGSIHIIKKDDSDDDEEPELPDPTQNVDPDTFLAQLVQAQYGFTLKTKDAISLKNFFPKVTEDEIAAYDIKLVAACREDKVETVKSLVEENGMSAKCCNRFGESLLHMACRRGFKDMVHYFLEEEPNLSVRIRDDCGRTPAHDTCWNPQAQTEILKWIIERDPSLLLITDKRGSTPFAYARPQDWPTWRQFLLDNRSCFDALKDCKEVFQ